MMETSGKRGTGGRCECLVSMPAGQEQPTVINNKIRGGRGYGRRGSPAEMSATGGPFLLPNV
jgi:hypothetical protein